MEWVQALNNIGTDYQRLGILDEAQIHHYDAWKISTACADTSFTNKKSRVVSLNRLGNIYITLGNYVRADSVLRMALHGEQQLHSAVGQAINYANLGSIFEHQAINSANLGSFFDHHRKTDSAWVYYRKSMALNMEAGNNLGISLCHIHFGSLYENARQYDKAMMEYETAYRMMQQSKDKWHTLNALIALARIYHLTGNEEKGMRYLSKAKQMAQSINSPEHLAEIYTLYYKHNKQTGDYRSALTFHEMATKMKNYVLDMKIVNRIQNQSIGIERDLKIKQINETQCKLNQEHTIRISGFIVFGIALLILTVLLAMMLYTNRLRHRNHLILKNMSALRENFFTNVTHEFRTPLTMILALSHDLQSSEAPDVKDKAINIERHGKSLLSLVNQLLDISKIKSSVGNANWYNGDITVLLTMIFESYRDYARTRNIDLQFFVKEAVEMDFVPEYVNKVMNNILSNAFKFTPEYGRGSISVWRENERLFVDIKDTGEGMDKETLSHIFEPFYQGESARQDIGTGVGLTLVKQIIDAVEGEISVESEVGKGTTFHLNLPIHNDSKQKIGEIQNTNTPLLPKAETALTDSEDGDNQCRLLIIEDNRDIAAYIGSQFAGRYAVSYATNGKDGLDKAVSLVPNLIITDLMMPGVDGLEVCRQVRANEIIDHIPIIVVTAKITEEERIKGLEAGADAYLTKPFNTEELRTRVEKLIERHRGLYNRFSENANKDKQQGTQLTDVERRFLAKVSDFIYLQINYKKGVEVSQIASAMCMSERQFYRKINAITNDTPTAYIQRVKINKAKNLLDRDSQMSFGEIADICGFNDYSNFVRTFKKVYGVTPTEYRRSNVL